jgi:lipopolysaccharide/colanic/teichoic acid biosynthesis glycosyltransferase
VKRLLDFILSLFGLLILSPLFLLIGLLIIIDDNGPVFFVQERIGRFGKPFVLYKFRSMKINKTSNNNNFEPGNTTRVTKTGKYLRKTKLDELPQLYNVLKGDLSLVGPRPEVRRWVDVYPERWAKIHSIRPGITDNASILFRNEEEILSKSADPEQTYMEIILPTKLDLYENYLKNHSFFGDIKLILKTVTTLVLK